jgi:hypothetical protein
LFLQRNGSAMGKEKTSINLYIVAIGHVDSSK